MSLVVGCIMTEVPKFIEDLFPEKAEEFKRIVSGELKTLPDETEFFKNKHTRCEMNFKFINPDKITYHDQAISGVIEQMNHCKDDSVNDESVRHMDMCARVFPESIAESRRKAEIYTAKELESATFAPVISRSTIVDLYSDDLCESLTAMFEDNDFCNPFHPTHKRAGVIHFAEAYRLIPAYSFLSKEGIGSQEYSLCKCSALANVLIWGKEVCPLITNYPSFYRNYPVDSCNRLTGNYLYIPDVVFFGNNSQMTEPVRLGETPRLVAMGGVDVISVTLYPTSPSHLENFDLDCLKESICKKIHHVLRLAAAKKITHLAIGGIEQMCPAFWPYHKEVVAFTEETFRTIIDESYLCRFEYIIMADHTGEPVKEINFTAGGQS